MREKHCISRQPLSNSNSNQNVVGGLSQLLFIRSLRTRSDPRRPPQGDNPGSPPSKVLQADALKSGAGMYARDLPIAKSFHFFLIPFQISTRNSPFKTLFDEGVLHLWQSGALHQIENMWIRQEKNSCFLKPSA